MFYSQIDSSINEDEDLSVEVFDKTTINKLFKAMGITDNNAEIILTPDRIKTGSNSESVIKKEESYIENKKVNDELSTRVIMKKAGINEEFLRENSTEVIAQLDCINKSLGFSIKMKTRKLSKAVRSDNVIYTQDSLSAEDSETTVKTSDVVDSAKEIMNRNNRKETGCTISDENIKRFSEKIIPDKRFRINGKSRISLSKKGTYKTVDDKKKSSEKVNELISDGSTIKKENMMNVKMLSGFEKDGLGNVNMKRPIWESLTIERLESYKSLGGEIIAKLDQVKDPELFQDSSDSLRPSTNLGSVFTISLDDSIEKKIEDK
ncbi:hypothetical protein M0R19_04360 [Candidatus Pacearchaeota archaeon]|jgi:hypothetical protein|nr:hypothetical protein [Candidatus Pacearchaeota archaeon]